MLSIVLVVATIYVFGRTQKCRKVALEKGIEKDDLTVFAVSLWLYVIPPIFGTFFQNLVTLPVAIILLLLYIPGILMSKNLLSKLDTGSDYHRKAGKEFANGFWLGSIALGISLFN